LSKVQGYVAEILAYAYQSNKPSNPIPVCFPLRFLRASAPLR